MGDDEAIEAADDDPVRAFAALPRRVFLDSTVLQTLLDYGGCIWEGEDVEENDRARTIPHRVSDIYALQRIFRLIDRGGFEFAISENSLREVADKRDSRYMQWSFYVLDHWLSCEDEGVAASEERVERTRVLDDDRFNYLGQKDRMLLRDSLARHCDAFLTMDRRLTRNGAHLRAHAGVVVLSPTEYWELLEPWARLFC